MCPGQNCHFARYWTYLVEFSPVGPFAAQQQLFHSLTFNLIQDTFYHRFIIFFSDIIHNGGIAVGRIADFRIIIAQRL